jgi:RNA polymerase sigma-70 factor (ECF subfamily)
MIKASTPDVTGLVERLPVLRGYAFRLTRDTELAAELVQETIVRALANFHLYRSGTNLTAWLTTILHNEYVSQVRHRTRASAAILLIEESAAPRQEAQLIVRDLVRMLEKLTTAQREAILAIGHRDLCYEAAAEDLGVPVGTVRSRLSRGREKLRELMR